MNEVLNSLRVFNEPKSLVKFCDILKSQDNANLVRIANSILRELGMYTLCLSILNMYLISLASVAPPILRKGGSGEL